MIYSIAVFIFNFSYEMQESASFLSVTIVLYHFDAGKLIQYLEIHRYTVFSKYHPSLVITCGSIDLLCKDGRGDIGRLEGIPKYSRSFSSNIFIVFIVYISHL